MPQAQRRAPAVLFALSDQRAPPPLRRLVGPQLVEESQGGSHGKFPTKAGSGGGGFLHPFEKIQLIGYRSKGHLDGRRLVENSPVQPSARQRGLAGCLWAVTLRLWALG